MYISKLRNVAQFPYGSWVYNFMQSIKQQQTHWLGKLTTPITLTVQVSGVEILVWDPVSVNQNQA